MSALGIILEIFKGVPTIPGPTRGAWSAAYLSSNGQMTLTENSLGSPVESSSNAAQSHGPSQVEAFSIITNFVWETAQLMMMQL